MTALFGTDRRGSITFATFAAAVVVLSFTALRARPPSSKGLDAPLSEYSSARARTIHQRVFPTDEPHPLGSAAARRVEHRIVGELQRLGVEHEVQDTFVCTNYDVCARVRNIIGRLPGQSSREAVLLTSHYDSVAAGPGAADDGASVAAMLEIARLMKGERHKRDVLLLFDEGEEAGLLGADAFMRKYPGAAAVVAVVNGEARGTSGQSFMFESSPGNQHLIALMGSGVPRPVTSSVYYSIYERLPNDTDFTIFKKYSKQGLNFAFLGDVARYHTPLDRRQLLDAGTLQHHGDNLLGATRALADGNLADTFSNATFFDIGGFGVARWPESLNRFAGFAILFLSFFLIRRKRLRQNWWSLLLQPSAILASAGLVWALVWLLGKAGALPTTFMAKPASIISGAWLLGLVIAGLARTLRSRDDRDSIGITAVVFATLSLLVAWFLPGAAYLFLIPAFFQMLILLIPEGSRFGAMAEVLPFAVAGMLIFPLLWQLYPTLGNPALAVIAACVSAVALLLPPVIFPSRRFLAILAAVATLLLAVAFLLPPYSKQSPRRLNVVSYRDASSPQCRWILEKNGGPLPKPLGSAAAWSSYQHSSADGMKRDVISAVHPCGSDAPPGVEQTAGSTEGGTRILRYRFYSRRQAPTLTWTFENGAGLAEVLANEESVPLASPRASRRLRAGWRQIQFRAVPPLGVIVELHLRGPQVIRGVLTDSAPLNDSSSAALIAARDASTAVRSDEGDLSIIRVPITLGP